MGPQSFDGDGTAPLAGRDQSKPQRCHLHGIYANIHNESGRTNLAEFSHVFFVPHPARLFTLGLRT